MSFDLVTARRLAKRGRVVRIVVAGTQGSVPRDLGAAMLVGPDWTEGTIGGGTLEFEAIDRAREVLVDGKDRLDRMPLGPALGQCCGGAVTLFTEVWDAARLAGVDTDVVVRPLPGGRDERPLSVTRHLNQLRDGRAARTTVLLDGWLVEPVFAPQRTIWIWGAGHVGRAIVDVLAPLPQIDLCWIDTDLSRFPDTPNPKASLLMAENPAELVSVAPPEAEHYVLTFSHALDLEICHRVLSRSFGFLGLIGSATKRARFNSRLRTLGHGPDQIDRMTCPIGDPMLGKHPQEIALGVGTEILQRGIRDMDVIGQRA